MFLGVKKKTSGMKWIKKLQLLGHIPVRLYEALQLFHLYNYNYTNLQTRLNNVNKEHEHKMPFFFVFILKSTSLLDFMFRFVFSPFHFFFFFLRLCVTQKALQLPVLFLFFSFFFSSLFLDGLTKAVCVFFFYCCFKCMWPISDLLTWYTIHFNTFSDKQ